MSEWSKEHAWKVCMAQKVIVGSNPIPSTFSLKSLVKRSERTFFEAFLLVCAQVCALKKLTHLFAFEAGSEDDRLDDYAMCVKLPDWLGEK